MKLTKRLICIAVLCCILFWVAELAKCEYLTYKYGDEFDQLWIDNTMLIDPAYWKVLKYTSDHAHVYYVSPEGKGGTVLYFSRINETWTLSGWGASWSKTGSAEELIWPYIR